MPRGFTLIEVAVWLALLSAALAIVTPPLRQVRDTYAVLAAREAVAGAMARTRAVAIGRGGATAVVDSVSVSILASGDTLDVLSVWQAYGVTVDTGRRPVASLRYDARGVGRIASRTLRFRRGSAERSLIVSSFGRLRRP